MKEKRKEQTVSAEDNMQKERINENPIWKWIFWGVAALGLVVIMLLSRGAGNSGDEHFHLEQAEHVYNYYATGGEDSTAAVVTPNYNLPYYGQSVDNLAYFITKTFHIDNIYDARHLINSICGWMAMFFAALIAYRIAGWRAAVITFVLMFFSPRFLGHSLNNLKDLPLATGVIFGIYCLTRFFQEFPKVKWSTAIMLALSIAFATSVRFAGILIVAYFGLFGLILYLQRNRKKGLLKQDGKKEFGKLLAWGFGISIVGIVITTFLWPFLLKSPIAHFKEAMANMSAFATSIRQVFEGSMQWSDLLPWYYTPKFILMTIPVAVIIGMILSFVFCWRKKEDRFWSFFIFFTFFFPVFWIVYTRANVYGGWRHAMFSYPPMAVAAGLGFNGLAAWVEQKLNAKNEKLKTNGLCVNLGTAVLVLVLLIGPIRHVIANHPYEYVYFNELAGGVKKAYGNYELDYYYHSTREAAEWVMANAPKKADGSKTIVATWHLASVNYFLSKDSAHFQPTFVRWYEKENSDWDYAIFTVTGINPEYIVSNNFPPKNTVKTIEVDGKPIAIILKREDHSDYLGYKYKSENKIDSAFLCYHQALQKDPQNMGALLNLGELYMRINQPDSGLLFLNKYLEIDPEAEVANYMKAYTYLLKGDAQESLNICHQIQKHNVKYAGSYYLAIQIYLQQRDFVSANKEFMKLIDIDRVDDQFVQSWLKFNEIQNIDAQHAYVKMYKAMIKSFEKRGKKKEAEQYRQLLK